MMLERTFSGFYLIKTMIDSVSRLSSKKKALYLIKRGCSSKGVSADSN